MIIITTVTISYLYYCSHKYNDNNNNNDKIYDIIDDIINRKKRNTKTQHMKAIFRLTRTVFCRPTTDHPLFSTNTRNQRNFICTSHV